MLPSATYTATCLLLLFGFCTLALTAELLRSVEAAETALAELGFRDFRVRVRQGLALVQVTPEQWSLAAARREDLLERLRPLFVSVALDLTPRTPSE